MCDVIPFLLRFTSSFPFYGQPDLRRFCEIYEHHHLCRGKLLFHSYFKGFSYYLLHPNNKSYKLAKLSTITTTTATATATTTKNIIYRLLSEVRAIRTGYPRMPRSPRTLCDLTHTCDVMLLLKSLHYFARLARYCLIFKSLV